MGVSSLSSLFNFYIYMCIYIYIYKYISILHVNYSSYLI